MKKCGVCNSKNLTQIIQLKKFPLTGIFVKKKIKKFSNYYDQKLNICKHCGHLQLNKIISKKILYNSLYANRTSVSHLSDNSVKFFKNFLLKTIKNNNIGNVLEIGCNDIKLINSLKKNINYAFGIDPIWKNKKVPKSKNFKIIGDYAENINFKKYIKKDINVFLSTHNLEHIENPYKLLKKVVDYSHDNAKFFVEVPDAKLMIKNLRFDQIFHQHYHYFTLNSLTNLISRLNCKIVSKSINYDFWGGSLIVVFKKNNKLKKFKIKNDYGKLYKIIKNNFAKFTKHYNKLKNKLYSLKNIVGYGAGQMVPSLAYHLKSDLFFLDCIIDDNKDKHGIKYQNLIPEIKYFNYKYLNKKNVLITALDGVKAITKKLNMNNIKPINPLPK